MASFEYRFTVRLHDTDAAGVMFFANLFRHAHDAYEALMDDLGFALPEVLEEREYLLPLVHVEADYHSPLHYGEEIRALVSVVRVGTRSFSLSYRFCDRDGEIRAQAATVHAACNAHDAKGMDLPAALRDTLEEMEGD